MPDPTPAETARAAAEKAERLRRYDEAMDQYRATDPVARALAVVDCPLCDDDGYRGTVVCDHRDRSETTARGHALVQAELDKIRARKGGAA